MKSREPLFRSLAHALTRRMVVLGLLCALVAAGLQMAWVYHQEQQAFGDQVKRVTQTHLLLLSSSLWDIEPRHVQNLLDSIAAAPQVNYVLLEVSTGQRFQSGSPQAHENDPEHPGVTLNVPSPGDTGQSLGRLHIDFNQAYLRWQLAHAALQVGLISGLLTLVLGLANNLMVRRLLLKPMGQIASFALGLAPGKLPPPLQLQRPEHDHRDELDLVADGFLTLQQDIARYVDERNRHEAALAQQAADLDRAFKQRTTQLKAVTRYLEVLSLSSNRFMTVSLDAYAELMRHTLGDMVAHIAHCDMAVAEQLDSASPLLWRYVHQAPGHGTAPLIEGEELASGLVGDLALGWNHCRVCDLDQATPAQALAMQRHGARAMAWCAYRGTDSTRLMIALSGQPQRWAELNDKLTQMAADMLFNSMRRRRDQLTMEHMHRELQYLSHTDPLTGLANRRHFDQVKLEETRRALRNGLPLAVVSIDLDHFKAYNDSYGHAHGDTCLVTIAQLMRDTFHRAGELPARLGGEEFTVLLPGQSLTMAAAHAERLRARVIELALPHRDSPLGVVSVSIGLACLDVEPSIPEHSAEEQIAAVLEAADRALYEAKRSGRNRVQVG
nr:GGDEF domain-containing protein [uncultured Roseateles sp.]